MLLYRNVTAHIFGHHIEQRGKNGYLVPWNWALVRAKTLSCNGVGKGFVVFVCRLGRLGSDAVSLIALVGKADFTGVFPFGKSRLACTMYLQLMGNLPMFCRTDKEALANHD